jgi:hypothetical protein
VILKYEGDIKKAHGELGRLIARKADEEVARPAAPGAPVQPAGTAKKGSLH